MARQIFFIFLFFVIMGCQARESDTVRMHSESRVALGTFVRVDVCHEPQQTSTLGEALARVWQRLSDINALMSAHDDESDIGRLNRADTRPVRIHADTYHVLRTALEYSQLTDGAFDVTVKGLVDLWREAAEKNEMPPPERIHSARTAVGMDNLVFVGDNTVRLYNENTRVDLGGIAKGYAVDEAARILRDEGFEHFLIDAGGDLFAGGRNCRGRVWRIGIRDPRDTNRIIDTIAVSDAAVTTSGDYMQFFDVQGERLPHIINPQTGHPHTEAASATVVAPTAQEADALSTALCVMGGARGVLLIDEHFSGRAAALVYERATDGLKRYESINFHTVRVKENQ